MSVPLSEKATVYVVSEDGGLLWIFEHSRSFSVTLGYMGEVILRKNKDGIANDAVPTVIHKAVIHIPFTDPVGTKKEVGWLKGEEKRLVGELARSRSMLSDEKFTSRAPEAKTIEEYAKLEKHE